MPTADGRFKGTGTLPAIPWHRPPKPQPRPPRPNGKAA